MDSEEWVGRSVRLRGENQVNRIIL
jgi:hypothetical protein